jgi:integrase
MGGRLRNLHGDDIKYMEERHIQAFFKVKMSNRDRAMFRLMYHYGLRASEPGLLEMQDWDPVDQSLYIHRLKGSRSSRYRPVPIVVHALKIWLRERGNEPGPMFPSRNRDPETGKNLPISRKQIFKRVREICKAAGIPRELAHPHALKHSCGTHLYEKGQDLLAIQDWIGHKSAQNTRIYVDPSGRARDAVTAALKDWK